jgi:hypothetical protein
MINSLPFRRNTPSSTNSVSNSLTYCGEMLINGRDRVSMRPEMFSGEVPFFALHSSNGYRALALYESNHRSDCVFEQGGDAHMHVIWHRRSNWTPGTLPAKTLLD